MPRRQGNYTALQRRNAARNLSRRIEGRSWSALDDFRYRHITGQLDGGVPVLMPPLPPIEEYDGPSAFGIGRLADLEEYEDSVSSNLTTPVFSRGSISAMSSPARSAVSRREFDSSEDEADRAFWARQNAGPVTPDYNTPPRGQVYSGFGYLSRESDDLRRREYRQSRRSDGGNITPLRLSFRRPNTFYRDRSPEPTPTQVIDLTDMEGPPSPAPRGSGMYLFGNRPLRGRGFYVANEAYSSRPSLRVNTGKRQLDFIERNEHGDVAYHNSSGNEVIFGYAGTKSVGDAVTDVQIAMKHMTGVKFELPRVVSARNFTKSIMSRYPNCRYMAEGHSLGGYIAAMMSKEFNMPVVGYNAYMLDGRDTLGHEENMFVRTTLDPASFVSRSRMHTVPSKSWNPLKSHSLDNFGDNKFGF